MSIENIVSGKKFRVLIDAKNQVYDRISFWNKAQDIEFNNGKNAQETLGSIAGISDSLTSTSSNIAASAYAVKQLNDKITALASRPITLKKDLKYLGNMLATYPGYGIAFERTVDDYATGNFKTEVPSSGSLCYFSSSGYGSKEDTNGNVTDFGKSYTCSLKIPMVMASTSDGTSRAWAQAYGCITSQYQGSSYKTNIAIPTGYSSSISFENKFKKAAIVRVTLHSFNPSSSDTEANAQAKLDDILYGKKYTTKVGTMSGGSYSNTMEMTLWLDIYKKPNSFDIISVISNNDYEEYKTIDSYSSSNSGSSVKFTDQCFSSFWNAYYNSSTHVLSIDPYSSRYDLVTSYSSVRRLDTFSSGYDNAINNLPSNYTYVGCSTNSRYEYYAKDNPNTGVPNQTSRWVDYGGRFTPYINYNVMYPVIEFYGQ